jgi:hypothetical protein
MRLAKVVRSSRGVHPSPMPVSVQMRLRAGFLGAQPGQQAEGDVGVHQRGRSADVL